MWDRCISLLLACRSNVWPQSIVTAPFLNFRCDMLPNNVRKRIFFCFLWCGSRAIDSTTSFWILVLGIIGQNQRVMVMTGCFLVKPLVLLRVLIFGSSSSLILWIASRTSLGFLFLSKLNNMVNRHFDTELVLPTSISGFVEEMTSNRVNFFVCEAVATTLLET